MFHLFTRIIFSNIRSIVTLFFVILFTSTLFIMLRELTTNIESLVARETRPLFGTDLMVSPRGYASGDILPMIAPYLSGEQVRVAERREFSTTLLDRDGKAGLVQVVAYSGSYPQRGILKTEWVKSMEQSGQWEQNPPNSLSEGGIQAEEQNPHSSASFQTAPLKMNWERVAVTPWLFDRFASGGVITLDGRDFTITEKIRESSDLGFSLGTENHLIVLPSDLLSGSLLLSSGSRLDHDLLISFADERRATVIAENLKWVLDETQYRIRTYEDRTDRNLDTVETLTDYIVLILAVSSVFAFVILRSAHESFFENIARTLRITEILGLTWKRQKIILLMFYGLIFPSAFFLSIGLAYLWVIFLTQIPEAAEFRFFWSEVLYAFFLLLLIITIAWFPIWWTMGRSDETREKKAPVLLKHEASALKSKNEQTLTHKGHAESPSLRWRQSQVRRYIVSSIAIIRQNLFHWEVLVPLLLTIVLLFLLFGSPIFAWAVAIGAGVLFFIIGILLRGVFLGIFSVATPLRKKYFYLYDAIRTLVRPLTPTVPVTLSLISVTVFFLVFATFSLAFRSKLLIDSTDTANIYAINILESDREKVSQVIGSGAVMYDILRARIDGVNGKTLAEHLGEERPSGEFTREFNITTTGLDIPILRWKSQITRWEVSVDDEFATRLGVTLGDRITFLLSGREITLIVANVRESVREWFRPFFYFSFDPIEFANAPRTYFVAEYARDTEQWKRDILSASGPHVTFIDIESILTIVRDISAKVLSVIGLFFLVVAFFALWAIIAFFARMRPIEDMKTRLYTLFGAFSRGITLSISGTRITLFVVAYILSIVFWGILSYTILSMGGFFTFSLLDYLKVVWLTGVVYLVMIVMIGVRREGE